MVVVHIIPLRGKIFVSLLESERGAGGGEAKVRRIRARGYRAAGKNELERLDIRAGSSSLGLFLPPFI